MTLTRFQFVLFVSHGQVSVFSPGLDSPFNDWERQHIEQGFAWREGSVSFATLEEAGTLNCEAAVSSTWECHVETQRAIRVPYRLPADTVEIASISDSVVLKVGALKACALIFETWMEPGAMQARFTFVPQEDAVSAMILKADSNIRISRPLTMKARPA